MPKVIYTQHDGSETVVEAVAGDSVMQTAVRNAVSGILGQCGGSLSCATCHVFLGEENTDDFAPVSEDEDEMLDCAATEREDSSRLSCQLVLGEGQEIHVTVPDTQL